ncbi:MAG: LysR family transcriptional regulator [Myxococcales bacterium]|nr:MAG: LysR family transcriptional regulator [Myxococcales bacterium]
MLSMVSIRAMNLASIDLNLLVALEALLAERSVSRAARRLGLSQPATSHALGRLRELLGDPLLVRAGDRMEATPRALALEGPLATALTAVRAVVAPDAPFDPARSDRAFSLETIDYAAAVLLPPLMERLGREAPRVSLEVRTRTDDIDAQLARGALDLAIGLTSPDRPGLRQQPVLSDLFVCVLRRGHPALRRPLTLDRYCAQRHLLVTPTGRPGSLVDDLLAQSGRRRHVALRVPHFLLAPPLVARSDLVWTAPGSMAQAHAALLPLTLRPPPFDLGGFTLTLRWHERAEHDPGHRWLRELVAASAPAAGRRAAGRATARPPGG